MSDVNIPELLSKLPEGLEKILHGVYRNYLLVRIFLKFLPFDARAFLAETAGRQIIKACKEFDIASDEVRVLVYHIVAGLFLLEVGKWDCPWDLYETDTDTDATSAV